MRGEILGKVENEKWWWQERGTYVFLGSRLCGESHFFRRRCQGGIFGLEGLWLRLRELPITKVAEGLRGRRDKKSGRGRTAAEGVEGGGECGWYTGPS